MAESEVQQQIVLAAPSVGVWLMRNNSGSLQNEKGQWVRYGLGNVSKQFNEVCKSTDEIGITQVLITPEMVGRVLGVFTAIEVKPPGWKLLPSDKRGKAQLAFMNRVRACGGIAGFARSVEEFFAILPTTHLRNE